MLSIEKRLERVERASGVEAAGSLVTWWRTSDDWFWHAADDYWLDAKAFERWSSQYDGSSRFVVFEIEVDRELFEQI